ncbi:hypothetical protein SD78_3065 [Bacillus badius]|nr:hypothetical protein SD78_3065 [Bacillus badius]
MQGREFHQTLVISVKKRASENGPFPCFFGSSFILIVIY